MKEVSPSSSLSLFSVNSSPHLMTPNTRTRRRKRTLYVSFQRTLPSNLKSSSPYLFLLLYLTFYNISSISSQEYYDTNSLDINSNTIDTNGIESELPEFMGPIPNLTVTVGRDAHLACNVENLKSYKAAWLRVEDKGILTIHDHIITRNYRINLIHSEERQFTLVIKNVQPSDAGGYMCQINTVPMKYLIGYIDVVIPPQIIVEETSHDEVVTEGSNVTLKCRARGHPPPAIQWKREDRKEIHLQSVQGRNYVVHNLTGEVLTILRVTRVHMGAMLCIASNGIQPSVSRRVFLRVQFPPAVWIPSPSVQSELDQDVTLNCHIEAFPTSVNYWIRSTTGKVLSTTSSSSLEESKYVVEEETKDYKSHLTLTIRRLQKADLGLYTCLAKNTLGVQEGSVRIQEMPPSIRGIHSSGRRSQDGTSSSSHKNGNRKHEDGHHHSSSSSSSSSSPSIHRGRSNHNNYLRNSGKEKDFHENTFSDSSFSSPSSSANSLHSSFSSSINLHHKSSSSSSLLLLLFDTIMIIMSRLSQQILLLLFHSWSPASLVIFCLIFSCSSSSSSFIQISIIFLLFCPFTSFFLLIFFFLFMLAVSYFSSPSMNSYPSVIIENTSSSSSADRRHLVASLNTCSSSSYCKQHTLSSSSLSTP